MILSTVPVELSGGSYFEELLGFVAWIALLTAARSCFDAFGKTMSSRNESLKSKEI